MPLSTFHPVIQQWFKSRFGTPSPPQEAGWPHIRSGRDTLICAPTGTGKTLTAFMACLDDLFRQGLNGTLRDETQVVYVSPLKALSNDIQKNLREPLEQIAETAHNMGLIAPQIRVLVRTGDTPNKERLAMIKRPPHILVTTPESLFILLTAQKSREFLKNVKTVIVDEIHAVARDKRGAHLALSLERLDALRGMGVSPMSANVAQTHGPGAHATMQRIGLSATQRPVELVANFLVGSRNQTAQADSLCHIVNLGHLRKVELSLEIPSSPLEAVCSHETWEEVYERLTGLISAHRTTLIFVNTRRMCERLAAHLSKRLGEDAVTSHHGSLSRAQRLNAEERLKSGSLKALVATASLELGIDIGSVDLVCQIGITSSIGTLLQRAGRSGHSLLGTSRAKIFALTRDELCSAAALLSAVKNGRLDKLEIPDAPQDILAQQIVAACAAEDWDEDALYQLVRRAWNYRDLSREDFDRVVQMLAEGFSVRRGNRGALVRYDGVNRQISARKGARLAAITSGGAIPDTADYMVVQEPQGIVVGSLNEDFAVESTPGDIFQLGNTSWKILKIEPGRVRVEDARGQPPSIPFWLGEAPGRSDEFSAELSRLRAEIDSQINRGMGVPPMSQPNNEDTHGRDGHATETIAWIMSECTIERAAAEQLYEYLANSKKVLGTIPTLETLVLERFFDETGGMQLVLHAPYGRRINWAWGLALRKRFCRGFNFELQAAANENALLLSLGPQHSFPLSDVFHYLSSNSVEELLIQAMLVAPVFQTRWRWDASRALALLRFSGGKKVPPALQRMRADDLLAAVFPHAAACPETLEGDRDIPDHPLVNEVVHDCLHEAMDLDGLRGVLRRIENNELNLVARDTTEPSLLAHEILTAKPYAFLDDAPLEERRTQAVFMRRGMDRDDVNALGALDSNAIAQVREEAWPDPQNPAEMHDALFMMSYAAARESDPKWTPFLESLANSGRAARFQNLWLTTERVPLFEAVYPNFTANPPVEVPARERAKTWTKESALIEIVRGRMEVIGPATSERMAAELELPTGDIDQALLALESQGSILRGQFELLPLQKGKDQWCDRRLLARIHRYTLEKLRREIEPVSAADYMRFLFSWQHADSAHNLEGVHGVQEVLTQLQGCEISAVAWERDVLPLRVRNYDRRWLDQLSHSGEVSWGRRFPAQPDPEGKRHSGQVRHSPIGLYLREQIEAWLSLAPPLPADESHLSSAARQVLALLRQKGAVFFQNLVKETNRLPIEIETALGELVAFGFITGDGLGGLRALLIPPSKRAKINQKRRAVQARRSVAFLPPGANLMAGPFQLQSAGRWSLFRGEPDLFGKSDETQVFETVARALLRRWGVVFHRVVTRETGLPPWRDLLRVYRRMEARGELRGGRFVEGFSGEQYALPEAVEHLRAMRRAQPDNKLITVCGADPLNLAGIITPGEKVAARAKSRIVYRNGVPVAIKDGREVRILEQNPSPTASREIYAALIRKAM